MIGMMAKNMGSNEDQPLRKIASWIWDKTKSAGSSAVSMVPFSGSSSSSDSKMPTSLLNSGTLDSAWVTANALPPKPGIRFWVWIGVTYFMVSLYQEHKAYRRILALPVGAPAPPPPPPTPEEIAAAEAAKGPHPPRALAGALVAPPPPPPPPPP